MVNNMTEESPWSAFDIRINLIIVLILIGFSISGIKLLPMAHFLSRNPRLTYWREPVLLP
jgi:hypothetical protein